MKLSTLAFVVFSIGSISLEACSTGSCSSSNDCCGGHICAKEQCLPIVDKTKCAQAGASCTTEQGCCDGSMCVDGKCPELPKNKK
mgnify:CR=1 FL=1